MSHVFAKEVRKMALLAAFVVVSALFVQLVPMSAHASGYYDGNYYNNYDQYGSYDRYGYDGRYDNQYGYSDQYHQRPSCSITLSYDSYGSGSGYYNNSYLYSPATLRWNSDYANSAYITPDVGSVGPDGSRTVYPRGSQSYAMSVSGPGGNTTCQITAVNPYASHNYSSQYQSYDYNNYNNYNYGNYGYTYPYSSGYQNYTYPQTYQYPATYSYVPLSQVPYTGADFGLIGTLLSWLVIVLAASVGAGVIAHRQGFTQKLRVRFRA